MHPAETHEVVPGSVIAEFINARDAREFCRLKGSDFTITAGINLLFAVRPWIKLQPQESPQ